MKKLYVVMEGFFHDGDILMGIFSSKKKAENYVVKLKKEAVIDYNGIPEDMYWEVNTRVLDASDYEE